MTDLPPQDDVPGPDAAVRLTSLAHGGGCGCKIAPALLETLLGAAGASSFTPSPDLLVDASTRDDAAVYRLSDDVAVVATTDFFTPIVDDPYDFGRIAATNALSDIYAMGATPIFCLAILGMPTDKLSPATIGEIVRGGRDVAEAAGAPIAGGHSIDTAEPIYGLAAIGRVHPKRIRTNAGARVGDVLILGKPLGVGILSAAFKRGLLFEKHYFEMLSWTTLLNRPGIALAGMDEVHAMTDVTGFGLLGHAAEMARAAKVRIEIEFGAVPRIKSSWGYMMEGAITGASARNWASIEDFASIAVEDHADEARTLLTDPQTSGGLLVACAPSVADEVVSLFHADGHVFASVIGRVAAGAPGVAVI
ncbi:MAG: selenide, water dikinase SelD [Alphaproteobacteria bacterium]|nr:selenide, water dikinase SelD [Alphaproteobacteria bacterium]